MSPGLTLPLLAVTAMSASAPASAPTMSQSDLSKETESWHQQRMARLTSEEGFLTLVALDWLDEGENRVGSAEGSTVRLPSAAPSLLGTYTRRGKQVSFQPAKGVTITLDGKPFKGGAVKTDEDGPPAVLRHGSLQLLAIIRGDRVGIRVRDSEAPLRQQVKAIDRYPVSVAWRKQARFEPAAAGKTIGVPNVLGDVEDIPLAGTAIFTHEGKEHRLDAVKEGEQLFFIFADPTNKTATYGAGRFLYASAPKDGRLVLDFNRAYNPPCAFTAFATCPLPPKQNRLPVAVEAGEKRFAGGH